jgi:hypothetical protein
MAIAFLDTEFKDLLQPELLSFGLVTLDPPVNPSESYVELDLTTDIGRARRRASSDFVEECFRGLSRGELRRHHALADAMACAPHSSRSSAWQLPAGWVGRDDA